MINLALSDVTDSDEVQKREVWLDSEQSLLPIHAYRRQNQRIAEGDTWKWLACSHQRVS